MTGTALDLEVVPLTYAAVESPLQAARALDDGTAAEALARDVGEKARGFGLIIAPPMLGLERHAMVRRVLGEAAGAPVIETLAHTPSVPGVRLQRALDRAILAAGIDVLGEIALTRAHGNRVTCVVTSDQVEVKAGAFVLATGRFIAGGVSFSDRCRVALFDLPVVSEAGVVEVDSPDAVVRETPVESHPLMTAGVQVNDFLQPQREGRAAFENLFAAGMTIGGFASRYALCADGVAMSTGFLAGEAAACGMGGNA